jgi:hypothetical protein
VHSSRFAAPMHILEQAPNGVVLWRVEIPATLQSING